jgi:hypothetical protein
MKDLIADLPLARHVVAKSNLPPHKHGGGRQPSTLAGSSMTGVSPRLLAALPWPDPRRLMSPAIRSSGVVVRPFATRGRHVDEADRHRAAAFHADHHHTHMNSYEFKASAQVARWLHDGHLGCMGTRFTPTATSGSEREGSRTRGGYPASAVPSRSRNDVHYGDV